MIPDTWHAFDNLLTRLSSPRPPRALGLPRAARLPVAAALHTRLRRPVLLLTERADRARLLLEELRLWLPDAALLPFPEPNALFYERVPWSEEVRQERLEALTRLAASRIPGAPRDGAPPFIVASARAVMTRTLPRRAFLKAARLLRPGLRLQPRQLAAHLVTLGYEPVSIVTAPRQFARRGGLLDLWPPTAALPVRLDFFGDELETLRRFDPATQRTTARLETLLVGPGREFLLPETWLEAEPPEEFHLPLIHAGESSLLDYLPSEALLLVEDIQALEETFETLETQAEDLRREALAQETLPQDFPRPYLPAETLRAALETRNALALGPFSISPDPGLEALREAFAPAPRFGGQLKRFVEHIQTLLAAEEQVVVVSRQAQRLKEVWREYATPPTPPPPPRGEGQGKEDNHPPRREGRGKGNSHSSAGEGLGGSQSPPPVGGRVGWGASALTFQQGSLSEGWILTPKGGPRRHLFTDGEIFGWRPPQPRRRASRKSIPPESAYADLNVGDWVVHADYGIGMFQGMVARTIEGIRNEYLLIEYAEGDELYVPVHQADRLTRYIGPDARRPRPTRLGSTEWQTIKQRVKEAVRRVAEDLLELYARRQVARGFAFSPDSYWQQELEASFPYIETPDQLRVLQEVKGDMEAPRPMDRLICGDVGYGKTEIALRAAFKAVMDGKQVLVLVPTTVLAQQHYRTFRQRLAAFPVTVEMLSRFRTPREQRAILRDLSRGALDILIGTHRLLSADVQPKALGLLIIDEEQRFGVSHKEKLKRMRASVDVLTLTATPIPRTLYMALTGVRDISTLETPPAERLPVVTHVGPYNKNLVRQAILRELERGGQVFFVHNRVKTIQAMRAHLEKLVPAARIGVGHGQMPEKELAAVMRAFTGGEIDVLLSTSIIESGLDIPNANTLIVDRADTFGLAQLYQLRGRVGRGGQRAYAYFFRHRKLPPTPEARLRLETIAEHTHLGAGFAIAMRDLEIRGAGDLLGTRQHGHMAAVGFHLYTRLLANAVRRLQRESPAPQGEAAPPEKRDLLPPQRARVSIDLPLPVSIPASYVPDQVMRLSLYRRLADVRRPEEVAALREEFADRFGPLPPAVENLLYQVHLRLLAERAGVRSVSTEQGQIVLRFGEAPPPEETPAVEGVRRGQTALWFNYRQEADWRARLAEILERLGERESGG